MKRIRLGGWLVLMVLTLACQAWEQPRNGTATPAVIPSPTATRAPATPQPPITPATATPTPTLAVTPSMPTQEVCPARKTPPLPARPATLADYPATLLAYLNAGADPQTLVDVAQAWAALPFNGEGLLRADLTGDGTPETVALFTNPLAEHYPPDAVLLLFGCHDGAVTLLQQVTAQEWSGLALFAAEDLTQDGKAELLWAEVSCGAHTCFYTTHVSSWNGTMLVERLAAPLEVAYASYTVEAGQVLVSSSGIASVGAGPQLPATVVLRWDGTAMVEVERVLPPITYRYHQFLEGERALAAGDLDAALAAYEETLSNAELLAWAAFTDALTETEALFALARWRLMEVDLLRGEAGMASFHYQQLQQKTPPGETPRAVLALARAFWEAYQQGGDVAAACAAARAHPQREAVLAFLNSFGYANPTYEAEDLCPGLRN